MSIIAGCATIQTTEDIQKTTDGIAEGAGFKKEYMKAGGFNLLTYQKIGKPGDPVRIYIEGDGRAWISKTRLSEDPTPSDPIALWLAVQDPTENVVYIARPGQFTPPGGILCDPAYWSSKRFSREVIAGFNKTIDIIKTKASASGVEVVGFSGGAAICVLVAADRKDVKSIRTVAGNLGSNAVCKYNGVSLMAESLDPFDYTQSVKDIPQRHFAGSRDTVIPLSVTESFVGHEGSGGADRITIIKGATHTKGWRERWKEIVLEPAV